MCSVQLNANLRRFQNPGLQIQRETQYRGPSVRAELQPHILPHCPHFHDGDVYLSFQRHPKKKKKKSTEFGLWLQTGKLFWSERHLVAFEINTLSCQKSGLFSHAQRGSPASAKEIPSITLAGRSGPEGTQQWGLWGQSLSHLPWLHLLGVNLTVAIGQGCE